MSREWIVRGILGVLALVAGFLVWSLAYEVVVGLRWNPHMAGDGAVRWGLLRYQFSRQDYGSFLIAWQNFWPRLVYSGTRMETGLRGLLALGAVGGLVAAVVIAGLARKAPTHYGDARLGTLRDARRHRLLAKQGLVLGQLNQVLLRSDDPSHVLVVGPTRSGKGVSFIIPNGIEWRGSSVWFDPKQENWGLLSGVRAGLGDQVFLFAPGQSNSHRYNPLDFVRKGEGLATDCAVIASFIIPEGHGSGEIWARTGRQLLAALIGMVATVKVFEGRRTLRSVVETVSDETEFSRVLKFYLESADLPVWVGQTFRQMLAIEPETRNSALFNVIAALNPWSNDLLAAATETSDFDFREFRRRPTALFIGCSVAQLDVFRPILKLLIQQIHDCLMQGLPSRDEKFGVLMMIDEFRQLGRMDALVSKLSVNAGYGFRMCLILQDLSQLDEVYNREVRETTLSACQVKIFIRVNDLVSAEYVSTMLGERTTQVKAPQIKGDRGMFAGRNYNIHYQARPLRSSDELRLMDSRKSIVLIPNSPGFEVQKLFWYKVRHFRQLVAAGQAMKVEVPAFH